MVKDRPLRDFLLMIERGEPLTFSSWGRHEWMALFGERNGYVPKDGYFYFDRLCNDLTVLLQRRPDYYLGLPEEVSSFGDRVPNYLSGLGLEDLAWYKDVFKVESAEQLQAVVGTASRVPLLVVGPPKLRKLRNLLRFRAFVDVPPRNQYLCLDDIVRNTLAALEDFKRPTLVTVSAEVVAPLVIDELHKRAGTFHQLVDVGKLWEPFAQGLT